MGQSIVGFTRVMTCRYEQVATYCSCSEQIACFRIPSCRPAALSRAPKHVTKPVSALDILQSSHHSGPGVPSQAITAFWKFYSEAVLEVLSSPEGEEAKSSGYLCPPYMKDQMTFKLKAVALYSYTMRPVWYMDPKSIWGSFHP